jgi:hypothetical protein
VQVDTRDVTQLHLGDRATIKLEALPWQQFGLAYGELKALTPDTKGDDSARETGEEGTSPELKKQANQSPIHIVRISSCVRAGSATCPTGLRYAPACGSSPTSRSGAARSSTMC